MNDLFTPKGNWDNHKILLELALKHTEGSQYPILELGAGDGSSPCLQAYSKQTGRTIESYDFNQEWADKWNAKKIDDWDEVDWTKRYSVALVDESPGEHRHKSLMLLKDTTDIVIVHDSEPAATGYMLDKIWHFYKYKVDLTSNGAWATAMSNTVDVTKWVGHTYTNIESNQFYEVKNWDERNKIAFCSLAFGDARYSDQQANLVESIEKHYPGSFVSSSINWYPEDIHSFEESLYGFKPHLVKYLFNRGYRKIVFFDPAMVVNGDFLTKVEELGKIHGVIAVQDENSLKEKCSDICKDYFGLTPEWFENKHLVGGSFYYFDFNSERCKDIFNMWMAAEINGIFGSQQQAASEQINGHRYDETVMAIAMYKNGAIPVKNSDIGYCIDENSVLLKKHFK